ncbi:MAG: prolipoprotein diacylglyceryl transferase [Candidatus Promineifilaceae bacterium]
MTASTERKGLGIAPYWVAIALVALFAIALFLYHLTSGTTPSRVALHIEALDFDIYWYGIWIIGGVVLGCWVVASLASERARAIYNQTVPLEIQQQSLSFLGFSEEMQQELVKKGIKDSGEFLYLWGFDPRNVGLKKGEISFVQESLAAVTDVKEAWVEDAPWRIWNPEHVWNGIIWALIFGVVGARLYHILTPSPSMAARGINSVLDYLRSPYQLLNIRSGGLGIYGGIAGGALGLFIYARRARIPFLPWADLAVVGLALGQAVGRWGNFFNQELYGGPTDVPWAVHIDPQYRLPAYADVERFHPAFLYESLWSFLAFLLLHYLTKHYAKKMLPGEMTALYLILYAIGRSLLELVRLDSRTVSLGGIDTGLAVATFVSIIVAVMAALAVIIRRARRPEPVFQE